MLHCRLCNWDSCKNAPWAARHQGLFVDGYKAQEHVGVERLPVLVGLAYKQGSRRNVFYWRDDFVTSCGFLLLSTTSGMKEGFHELSSWIFEQPTLCSWSLYLMAALVYVDLLLKKLHTSQHGLHCSLLMGSACVKGSTIAKHCEALGPTYVVSRTSNNLSIKSIHWFNPMVHAAANHQIHLRP